MVQREKKNQRRCLGLRVGFPLEQLAHHVVDFLHKFPSEAQIKAVHAFDGVFPHKRVGVANTVLYYGLDEGLAYLRHRYSGDQPQSRAHHVLVGAVQVLPQVIAHQDELVNQLPLGVQFVDDFKIDQHLLPQSDAFLRERQHVVDHRNQAIVEVAVGDESDNELAEGGLLLG